MLLASVRSTPVEGVELEVIVRVDGHESKDTRTTDSSGLVSISDVHVPDGATLVIVVVSNGARREIEAS